MNAAGNYTHKWFPRVSCVRFSPNVMNPVIVSCGWDKVVKVSFSFCIPFAHSLPL